MTVLGMIYFTGDLFFRRQFKDGNRIFLLMGISKCFKTLRGSCLPVSLTVVLGIDWSENTQQTHA